MGFRAGCTSPGLWDRGRESASSQTVFIPLPVGQERYKPTVSSVPPTPSAPLAGAEATAALAARGDGQSCRMTREASILSRIGRQI